MLCLVEAPSRDTGCVGEVVQRQGDESAAISAKSRRTTIESAAQCVAFAGALGFITAQQQYGIVFLLVEAPCGDAGCSRGAAKRRVFLSKAEPVAGAPTPSRRATTHDTPHHAHAVETRSFASFTRRIFSFEATFI